MVLDIFSKMNGKILIAVAAVVGVACVALFVYNIIA